MGEVHDAGPAATGPDRPKPAVRFRRHLFAIAFIALVVLTIFLPALFRKEVFTFRDHRDYFQPLRYYTSLYIKTYNLPYWNPYSASGEPWLANPQTGVFYPPAWLFVILPFETAYMLHLAFHLFLLGCGAYLLFSRGASEGAALVGSVALTFSGPVLSLLDVSNNLATFAWVPLVIWCGLENRPRLAAFALALAFLGGEPFFAAVAALIYVVVVRRWIPIAIAGVGAFGLSAVQLFPFLELVRSSDRAARLPAADILRESMHPLDWIRVAIPPPASGTAFNPHLSQHFIPIVYIGVFAAALALLGAATALSRKEGRKQNLGWMLLLLAAVIVSAGAHLPLAGELVAGLPLTLFRYPSRMVPFGVLALSALAVVGWDRIRPSRRWADLLLAAVILADLVPRAAPLLRTDPFRPDVTEYSPLIGRTAKLLRIEERAIVDRGAWIAGYANLYHRRFDANTAAPLVRNDYMHLLEAALSRRDLSLLNLMSIGYVLAERPLPPLQPLQSVRGVTAYLNPSAHPMAEYWGRVEPFPTAEAALRATIERPSRLAVPVSGPVPAALASAPAGNAAVELFAVDSRRARVVVDAPAGGVIVITQQDAPGWRVFVDGVEKERLTAFGIFRAVSISRGRHEVIWMYTPRSIHFGAGMTFITLLALQLSTFVKRTQRKISS